MHPIPVTIGIDFQWFSPMSRKAVILIGLVVVALTIWGVQFLRGGRTQTSTTPGTPPANTMVVECETCQHRFRVSQDKLPSLPCDKCKAETAYLANYTGCKVCGTVFPISYVKYKDGEKANWEKKWTAHLRGEELKDEEWQQLNEVRLLKYVGTQEWIPFKDALRVPHTDRCPKCGNTDPRNWQPAMPQGQ